MKITCLGMALCSGYAAVAHFSDYPIFGVMYYVVFCEAFFFYAVLYQKGFKVPGLIIKAKIACRLRARSLNNKAERDGMRKKLRSIPPVGVKVGEFHTLERTSTPVFLHYVLVNIVNMLVTFK